MIELLQYNYPLSAAIISWSSAQLIKTVIYFVKHKKLRLERLTGAGGMPSAHSAVVCSLSIAISKVESINSAVFALSFIFAFIVMYDAMGVRRAAGHHAKEINRIKRLIRELDDELQDELDEKIDEYLDSSESIKELKEFLGHTPIEVLAGALLGILISMALPITLV